MNSVSGVRARMNLLELDTLNIVYGRKPEDAWVTHQGKFPANGRLKLNGGLTWHGEDSRVRYGRMTRLSDQSEALCRI